MIYIIFKKLKENKIERHGFKMKNKENNETYYIDEASESAIGDISDTLFTLLNRISTPRKELVFLCIGSDRVTGDSLGPMVGHHLLRYTLLGTHIYGTLEHPVHALNLAETIAYIENAHPESIIIAIDASLGSKKHQGYITLGCGPLKPGTGVHKKLPSIGDIFITGIINTSGSFEHLILQTTRLATVMRMTDCIASAIVIASQRYYFKGNMSTSAWHSAYTKYPAFLNFVSKNFSSNEASEKRPSDCAVSGVKP